MTNDPVTAFRLTQGLHAVFVSLAVIPAYLLCRRLGLPRWTCIAVAALTVAVPDAVYSSSMLADPLAYPLVLSAVYAGVCMSRADAAAQLAFAVFSALAIFARVQYVVVPLAVLAAELVADRFNVVGRCGGVWLALVLLIAPPALLLATLGFAARVRRVRETATTRVHPARLLHWVGLEAMLLTLLRGLGDRPGRTRRARVVLSGPAGAPSSPSQ